MACNRKMPSLQKSTNNELSTKPQDMTAFSHAPLSRTPFIRSHQQTNTALKQKTLLDIQTRSQSTPPFPPAYTITLTRTHAHSYRVNNFGPEPSMVGTQSFQQPFDHASPSYGDFLHTHKNKQNIITAVLEVHHLGGYSQQAIKT